MKFFKTVGAVMKSVRKNLFDDLNHSDYYNLFDNIPVYNLLGSSLDPARFDSYSFTFDSMAPRDRYIVRYECSTFSAEDHGVDNHDQLNRFGEAREKGRLVIDKGTFALIEWEREVQRHPYYGYPDNDNYILPSKNYKVELQDAYLKINFTQKGGQYVVNRILYEYTNDFHNVRLHFLEFTVTEHYEWYAMKYSRHINGAIMERLQKKTYLTSRHFTYDEGEWDEPLPEFHLAPQERVKEDIRSLNKGNAIFGDER
jgi:hypothetical protein